MITSILVATDGSPNAGRAVEFAIDLAARYQARLTITNVITNGRVSDRLRHMAEVEHIVEDGRKSAPPVASAFPEQLVSELGETGSRAKAVLAKIGDYLVDKAEKKAHRQGVKQVTTHVLNGDAAEVILDVARQEGADVIVTGSRGLGNLKSLFLGSVSYKISQMAPCTCIHVK